MRLKQIQLFELSKSKKYTIDEINEKLEQLAFSPCLPSMPDSAGWVAPVEEDGDPSPLAREINGYIAICMQIEEKILPTTVIRKELSDAVKQLELSENRKLRQKEKLDLKDQLVLTMLPRAFTKLTRVYAYIDNENHWLILGTTNLKLSDKLLSLFKKSVTDDIFPPQLVKPAAIMTQWLKSQNYPSTFSIGEACALQDPQNERRIVRCQQQNLFADSVQSFMTDGCDVIQLALSWQDRINFTLSNDFSLKSIQLHDELIEQIKELEAETPAQQFGADFLIMAQTLSQLLNDLLDIFSESKHAGVMLKTG